MNEGSDVLAFVFLAAGVLLIGYQAVRGWRAGVARRFFSLLALAGAYIVAVFGGELAVPVFRPLGYPDLVVQLFAGFLLAGVVFIGINEIGSILLKHTDQKPTGGWRWSYGIGGAALGAVIGCVTVWMALLGMRLLGTVAETEMRRVETENSRSGGLATAQPADSQPIMHGLARMKHSLESGRSGQVVRAVDPVPGNVYSVLRKVARLVAEPERVNLFLAFPGVQTMVDHPRIVALTNDPKIARDLIEQDYLALLGNKEIVAAATDPDLRAMLHVLELEKALDYALDQPVEMVEPGLLPIGEQESEDQ